jgi:hypothetical protein
MKRTESNEYDQHLIVNGYVVYSRRMEAPRDSPSSGCALEEPRAPNIRNSFFPKKFQELLGCALFPGHTCVPLHTEITRMSARLKEII